VLVEALSEVLADVLRDSLPAQAVHGVPRDLAIRHIVATFNTILHWWVRGQRDIEPAEADRIFKMLVLDGLPPAWRDAFTVSFGDRNPVG
jgi:hypothetical protein